MKKSFIAVKTTVFMLFALLAFGLAISFLGNSAKDDVSIVGLSTVTLLTAEEQLELPSKARSGDCDASRRLGHFFMTQKADSVEAEKRFRLANQCSNDPQVKDFLIRCIELNVEPSKGSKEVLRLLKEIEVLDPSRVEHLRPSVEAYTGQKIKKELAAAPGDHS